MPLSMPQRAGLRARALRAIRAFFDARGYTEVETPLRVRVPALELHIDAVPSGDAFLRTSPELHMKRLIAAGLERVYQLGPCFRRGERGRLHRPEFTMLEWYRAGAGDGDVLEETRALLRTVCAETLGGTRLAGGGADVDLALPWVELTVREAFRRWAGWDPVAAFDADRFDLDLVNLVEPALPRDRPVVLRDYPAAQAALARLKPSDPSVAERWEVYVRGIELANAFGELTDAAQQRARFVECARERRALGKEVYALDEAFLQALESGLPPCAGVALGVDRLVLLLAGADSLDEVLLFDE